MGAEILQERKAGWVYAAAWLPIVMVYAVAFAANGAPAGTAMRGAAAEFRCADYVTDPDGNVLRLQGPIPG